MNHFLRGLAHLFNSRSVWQSIAQALALTAAFITATNPTGILLEVTKIISSGADALDAYEAGQHDKVTGVIDVIIVLLQGIKQLMPKPASAVAQTQEIVNQPVHKDAPLTTLTNAPATG